MQKNVTWKKLLLFVCISLIVLSGCHMQLDNGLDDIFCIDSSHAVLQIPQAHAEHSDMLDEGQWLFDDDAASHASLHDKHRRTLPECRDIFSITLVLQALLAGIAALIAYASASVYHKSSCPTRGLSRILAFILNTDGQKDHFSFLLEV
ncbi:MAG: hypothetical protein MSA09_08525 [Lachnospiraceae bacterium]|nr:hypothetical protein [Lachnospiraceae bacterium]